MQPVRLVWLLLILMCGLQVTAQERSFYQTLDQRDIQWLAKHGFSAPVLEQLTSAEIALLSGAIEERQVFREKMRKKVLPGAVGTGLLITGIIIANQSLNHLYLGLVVTGAGALVVVSTAVAILITLRHPVKAGKLLKKVKNNYTARVS